MLLNVNGAEVFVATGGREFLDGLRIPFLSPLRICEFRVSRSRSRVVCDHFLEQRIRFVKPARIVIVVGLAPADDRRERV